MIKNLNFMKFDLSFKKKSTKKETLHNEQDLHPEFTKAIDLFITQRTKCGISLEELSKRTKISKNVLMAIENGWERYLPEKTYLNSMLKKIETELNLEPESLNGVLSQKIIVKNISKFKFKFINIDFLNSWTGSLLYLIFMFLSILALNSQQKYLLKINTITTDPISIENSNMENKNNINKNQTD